MKMDVLRRNTDYALRAMVYLAVNYNDRLVTARELSREGHFPYEVGCKVLQSLHKAGLVESGMGPKGGFKLSKVPGEITLNDVINVLQGGVRLNKCLLGGEGCELKDECAVSVKLESLQRYIDGYLGGITLEELLDSRQGVNKSTDL
jgi:Rrf2 family protein